MASASPLAPGIRRCRCGRHRDDGGQGVDLVTGQLHLQKDEEMNEQQQTQHKGSPECELVHTQLVTGNLVT